VSGRLGDALSGLARAWRLGDAGERLGDEVSGRLGHALCGLPRAERPTARLGRLATLSGLATLSDLATPRAQRLGERRAVVGTCCIQC
jgi:hypothetical protein